MDYIPGFQGFLDARESERRLAQLRERLAGGREQVPPAALEELTSWLEEQEKEVPVFTTHCANRQRQMQSVLNTFDRWGSDTALPVIIRPVPPPVIWGRGAAS